MPRYLKSFDELFFELLAPDTIGDLNVPLQSPPPLKKAVSADTAIVLAKTTAPLRTTYAYTDGWHHGGINE